MSFLTDVQELKTGLIIFRRTDVEHQNWYCRVRVPDETVNRYKTISLKTPNEREAKDKAFEHDSDIRFRKKHGVPVFDKTWGEVALEYSAHLKKMAEAKQITMDRWGVVNSYVPQYFWRRIAALPSWIATGSKSRICGRLFSTPHVLSIFIPIS
jgi:integrase